MSKKDAPKVADKVADKVEEYEVDTLDELTKLVQDAHYLYSCNGFGPLQQADFFAKVQELFAEGEPS